LLDGAASVLASNPGASMQDLARALGVGRATLHRHFSTRDELIREIAREATEEAMARVERARLDDGLADAALDRLVHELVPMGDRFHFLLSEPSLFGLQSSADPVMAEFAQAELEIRAAIVSLIERGKREGAFRLDVPTGWAVSASFALVFAAWEEVQTGTIGAAQAPGLVVTTLLAGIGGPGPR
jgi:AcrR family transcriptional regulator